MSVKIVFGILFLFLFIAFPSVTCSEPVSGVYTYQEKVGDKIIPFYWKVERDETQVSILVYEKDKSFANICSDDGATWEWRFFHRNKHDIRATRQGNTLIISGTKGTRPVEQTVEIDDRPWFQPLSYSLKDFLDSSEKEISFWTIRADSLEPIALVARKIGDEMFNYQGKPVAAQKVELRAEGFFSRFWHGSYWFRKKDNIFLMYRSVHGFPGTAETVVTLLGTPGQRETLKPHSREQGNPKRGKSKS